MRCLRLLLAAAAGLAAQPPASVPESETLFYRAEWRLIHAGNVRLTWAAGNSLSAPGWHTNLEIESAGLVSRLYRVNNHYTSVHNAELCVESTFMKTHEGSRRRETRVTFDAERGKASLEERDLVKNTISAKEIDISPCEHDVIGALYHLRTLNLEPGQSLEIPISDGKKAVLAKVEAQERETVKTSLGMFKTIRYEAFLFNNVLYRRRGRMFVWLTDDDRKLPVQIRVRLPFYIGTVTLQLEKDGTGKSG